MHDGLPVVGAGSDVKEGNFVGPLLVLAPRHLYRIASVTDIDELDAFDHATGVHVETGDDTFG
jgi:hypothetical protein